MTKEREILLYQDPENEAVQTEVFSDDFTTINKIEAKGWEPLEPAEDLDEEPEAVEEVEDAVENVEDEPAEDLDEEPEPKPEPKKRKKRTTKK